MEPPNKSSPDLSLFSSLPKDIVLSIFARISKSYYPTISLVSKSFRSHIVSEELDMRRYCLGTQEHCVYVCLQSNINLCDRRWFSLWIKPDDHDDQPLNHWTTELKCTRNLLLPVPCSYSTRLPTIRETIGSETYEISGQNTTDVWVYDKLGKRRKAPNMTVARKDALTCSLNGKLYVLGGCEGEESTYWGEVFDPKTQTWEPLPDPGADLRFSSIKMLEGQLGKVYVKNNDKNFVYLTKQSTWEVVEANWAESFCEIDNVWYSFDGKECLWYDTNGEIWRFVKGLSGIDRHYNIRTEICNYGGKLVIVWLGPATYPLLNIQKIWCAVISLENHNDDDEIWGQVEWKDIVLLIPKTYTLLRCIHSFE